MEKIIFVPVAAILFIHATPSQGAIFEVPLACEGEYVLSDTWNTDFNLGTSFTEITNVYISWSGEITASQDWLFVVAYQFVASLYELDPHDYYSRAYVAGGVDTYPDAEPFNLESVFGDDDWSLLLDGQSSIEISFWDTIHPLGSSGNDGTGTLNPATLVIEGNVVPEPGTVLLFGIGGLVLRKRRG